MAAGFAPLFDDLTVRLVAADTSLVLEAVPGRLLELDTSEHVDAGAVAGLVRGELQASYAP